jgi:hypothetical protein
VLRHELNVNYLFRLEKRFFVEICNRELFARIFDASEFFAEVSTFEI